MIVPVRSSRREHRKLEVNHTVSNNSPEPSSALPRLVEKPPEKHEDEEVEVEEEEEKEGEVKVEVLLLRGGRPEVKAGWAAEGMAAEYSEELGAGGATVGGAGVVALWR